MLWAIVMAGGQGTRLWPLSRKKNPKQFLKLFGDKTLIEHTVERVSKIVPRQHIYIITDAPNVSRTRKLFHNIPPSQIIGEPEGRNTAATIGLGAALIQKRDSNSVVGIFSAVLCGRVINEAITLSGTILTTGLSSEVASLCGTATLLVLLDATPFGEFTTTLDFLLGNAGC